MTGNFGRHGARHHAPRRSRARRGRLRHVGSRPQSQEPAAHPSLVRRRVSRGRVRTRRAVRGASRSDRPRRGEAHEPGRRARPVCAHGLPAGRSDANPPDDAQQLQPKLDVEVDRLGLLEQRQLAHLDLVYEGKTGARAEHEKGKARRAIEATFEEFIEWVTDSLNTEALPFVQVVAVIRAHD